MDKNFISKAFFFFLIIFTVYACYLLFKPFLIEIFAATILVSIFYKPYLWLVKKLGQKRNLAALMMCILIALIVIIPITNFIVYAAHKSVSAYSDIIRVVNRENIDGILNNELLKRVNITSSIGLDNSSIRGFVIDLAKKLNNWFVSGAASLVKGTTSFLISLIIIFFIMFFFFVDGKKMLDRLMYWTPLPNKYDKEIFKKFRDVSYSTVVSTFATALAQGIIGAIGFMIVGLPAFFAGVAIGFLSLLPYVGSAFVWLPAGVYLLFIGKIWQGIFLLLWGGAIVSTIDNVIRAYIIKGKAQVHPIFIILSIFGGIALFGFWGVIIGPLIISLAITVMHIYELEYGKVLEK
ncbi:MAG: AI-2E family transporter [Patescibacteria group bacterium]